MLYAEPWVSFLHWRYAPQSGTLVRLDSRGETVVLEPRLHSLLNYFLDHPATILSKEQLLDKVWGDEQGTDAGVMRAIGTLRKILADQSKPALFIETHARKGYCWVAVVTPLIQPHALNALVPLPTSLLSDASKSMHPAVSTDDTAVPHQHQANALLQEVLGQRSQPRFVTLRYFGMSVFAVVLLCFLFIFLLWRLGQQAYIADFPHQINISALPGEESAPLMSKDQQYLYYWYRQQTNAPWRLIRQDTQTHRKVPVSASFLQAGQLHWYQQQLVFIGEDSQGCGIFSLDVAQISAEQPIAAQQKIASCQQFVRQGLVVAPAGLFWLDQTEQLTQLWQLHQQKKQLVGSFDGIFRQPVQLLNHEHGFYVLLQEHHLSYQLFDWQYPQAEPELIGQFAFAIQHMSHWDPEHLLLSGAEKLQLYAVHNRRRLQLNTHAGVFRDIERFESSLLGVTAVDPVLDLVPYQPLNPVRSAEVSLPQWLTSNRNDWLFAGNGVFLSTRSGMPQIWRYTDANLRQLTKLKQVSSISQLIWRQNDLFAVIDFRLYHVDLVSGELQSVLEVTPNFRRYANCNGEWFWAERQKQGWVLYQQHTSPTPLLADVVDVRCGPSGHLVLQHNDSERLSLFEIATAELQQLPVQLNWRDIDTERWSTTPTGLFWLDTQGQLQHYGFTTKVTTQMSLPASLRPEAVYAYAETPLLFLLQRRSFESDIVRLQTMAKPAAN